MKLNNRASLDPGFRFLDNLDSFWRLGDMVIWDNIDTRGLGKLLDPAECVYDTDLPANRCALKFFRV